MITRFTSLLLIASAALYADNVLHLSAPVPDRPTITTLGVQLPITGDDNFNASVSVQYRVTGTATWQSALPLFRVHPETVAGYTVPTQFAGSIFDLKPGTTYEIQLHAVDPDGLDQTVTISSTTRTVPGDPAAPTAKSVANTTQLQSALAGAQPGDVITLANGTYNGTFQISRAGTATNPIVIRGASQDGVILDGGNCTGCNIFEFYGGGYVHLEQMTLQNAERAIRFQGMNSYGNVVRRVHIKNTTLGIGSQINQYDYYIADNILQGRLVWPQIYNDNGGTFASLDGIAIAGAGHVVAHNQISGYGDAMKTVYDGARAIDFYDNDVLFTYDNAVELDGSEGNVRCFRNRFTNTFNPISVQPIHGGPAYIFRNVVVNLVSEQLKFHPLALDPPQEPSGILVYNNTFVSTGIPELYLQTSSTSHYFEIENNIFITAPGVSAEAADWTAVIDHGTFDYNAYFPNGIFRFNNPLAGGYFLVSNFAGLQGLGMETHGLIGTGSMFASGLTAPTNYRIQLAPPNATLAAGAPVLDKGRVLANVTDAYQGAGPDMGALELGCPVPPYGPRAAGTNEVNEVNGCSGPVTPPVTLFPSIVIDTPAANATVSGSVAVTGWALENTTTAGTKGIASVSIFIDGKPVGAAGYGVARPDVCGVYPGRVGCPNVGWQFNLNAAGLTSGSHVLKAVATDTAGNSSTVQENFSVSLPAALTPSVAIESPQTGQTFTGRVTLQGWALENTSAAGANGIASVKILVDGKPFGVASYGASRPDVCAAYPGRIGCPNVGWTYTLPNLGRGAHIISAVATDTAGRSATVQITASW